jgi:gas vesicle protein
MVITIFVNGYLDTNFRHYEKKVKMVAATSETREQLLVPGPIEASGSELRETQSRLETFREEIASMDDLTERSRQERKGTERKKKYMSLASLWNSEMEQIVAAIGEGMRDTDRTRLMEEQNLFLEQRSHEAMKEISDEKTGIDENIDYMSRYIEVTRQRCVDLLKDYEAYLAT